MVGPIVTITLNNNVLCNAENDGSAIANATGGSGNYTYAWDNGETTQTASALDAGTHMVTVTDGNSCSGSANITITEPTALSVSVVVTDASCGNADGDVTANASDGTGNYTYVWDNGGTTQTISNLSANTYTVTVTDDNNCSANASGTISDVGGVTANIFE